MTESLVSPKLAEFVAGWEGFRPTAYRCPAGVWTLGYGTTEGVQEGDTITHAEALDRLAQHLEGDARTVDRLVKVPLHAYERDALISFTYNVGRSAFRRSSLLRLLNTGATELAANQFSRWNMAGGRVSRGLVRRRSSEQALFSVGDYSGKP